MIAGATMDLLIGNVFGAPAMGSMSAGNAFTVVANAVGIVAIVAVIVAARRGAAGVSSGA
jgi:hypothetical protein